MTRLQAALVTVGVVLFGAAATLALGLLGLLPFSGGVCLVAAWLLGEVDS